MINRESARTVSKKAPSSRRPTPRKSRDAATAPERVVFMNMANVQICPERSKSGAAARRMWGGCGEMPICQPSGSEMNQNVRIGRGKDLYFFNQISRYRRQPRWASVSRAREIQSRKVITNRAFFRRPMGGCERGAAAAALMPRRWGCARTMCPRSPLAAGAGSLCGVHPLRRSWGGATAVALMQGGGGGGRRWGGALRSGTVEAVRVATLILREHPKRHIID